jgi:hypothetical protein
VIYLDDVPDREFDKVFDRVSRKVDLKGAGTPAEVHRRLNRKIKEIKHEYRTDLLSQLRAESKIAPLRTLIFRGFGRRVIDEAVADPHGKIALVLKYGRKRAKRILLKRRKRLFT